MTKFLSPMEREILRERLREFESAVPMTASEKKSLRQWVRAGHDINSNPWKFCDRDGWEMNYLEALRIDLNEYERIKEMAEEK